MSIIIKLKDILTVQERKRAILLFAMILIMALFDMVGVASIMPFMAVLANPELLKTNSYFIFLNSKLGYSNPIQSLFALGLIVFVLLIVSLAFKALTTYAQLRFTLLLEYNIGKRILQGYLHMPYSWFLTRHSADLGNTILSQANQVIGNGMAPMLNLIAQGAVAVMLLVMLMLVDFKLALVVGLTLAVSYFLVFKAIRGYLARISEDGMIADRGRFAVVIEAFSAVKEVKLGGLEQAYIGRFLLPAHNFARHKASATIMSQLPRFALEAIAFGGMLLVVLYLMALNNGNLASSLPIIALYAFTGYRLMPALQQIYAAATMLGYVRSTLDVLHAELMSLSPPKSNSRQDTVTFNQAITLNSVYYTYPNSTRQVLNNLNLTIPAKSIVSLVGSTGSGKTTTVDLILGLLEIKEGALKVDGKIIAEHNVKSWQSTIGYVPQQIYLKDDTLAANIAFGVDVKDINQADVESAAKIANLHDFILNELPHQYKTTVGERGVRLSGGQRQRIAIARALYHKPKVLILDESTSALDSLTEQAIMDAVTNLSRKITIILIAHRLSTVKDCDCIFLMENGTIKEQGTFEQLLNTSDHFREMVQASYA